MGSDVDAAITRFDIRSGGAPQPAIHVVAGNLHIVCSDHPPTICTRQRIVKLLRAHLERYTAPEPQVPIVRIIVGDVNLSTEEARHALQRETEGDPLWEVIPALEEGRGDHVAVNGAAARFITIPVGVSFEDRGMRRDQHDAVAVMFNVRGAPNSMDPKRWAYPRLDILNPDNRKLYADWLGQT